MKFMQQFLLFVTILTSMQHLTQVHGKLINLGILDQVRNTIQNVFRPKSQQQTTPSQHTTTYLPIVQSSTYGVPTYIPTSSEAVQQQDVVSALPQDLVNNTVQGVPHNRSLINAPLRGGKCDEGYREVRGTCKKVYGRRRRRRQAPA
jgi:hypothetical protein